MPSRTYSVPDVQNRLGIVVSKNKGVCIKVDIIYSSPQKVRENTLIILGNFDGLHIGHISVIENGLKYAKEHLLKSGVFMFENHTRNVKLITPNELKFDILEDIAPDFLYIEKFNEELMKKSPEEFVQMLIKKLGMRAVCIGYDYRFGHMAQGDANTMYKLGKKYNFDVIVADKIMLDDITVSSTYIRDLITAGNVKKATRFLGRHFVIEGKVEEGLRNGTKLGFPTANISINEFALLPKNGVYAGYTTVDKKQYKSVINVGNNPTFDAQKITVESHIIDFDEDIYGKNAIISFAEYIREDKKFNSLEELIKQISKDKEIATKILGE